MRGAEKGFGEAWGTITAITAITADSEKLPAPTLFPVDALPKQARQLVREAAAAIGCPPDFVALPILAALGSAIGNSRRIKLKEGWTESAAIYGAVIADPGEKKTPAYKVAVESAVKRQAAFKEEQAEKLDEYARELREYEVDKRAALKDGLAAPPPPQAPTMSRTVVEDTTIEALARVLDENRRGVLVMRDELAGWVRAMDQYRAGGKGSDRQFYLSAWSNTYVSVDRKSKPEPLILETPFISVFGSIQPGVLSELGAGREDGLLDRFLFAYPEPVPSRWTDDEISTGARRAARWLYDRLSELHMSEDDLGDPDPACVSFSPDAKGVLVELINAHREEMESPGFPARLKGPWSKLEGYLARLTLIIAMCRVVDTNAPERVESDDVLRASVLIDYFKNQARRVYIGLYGENADDRLAEDVTEFLKERGGSWEGQPAELHERLQSAYKPARPDELSKKLNAIAVRSPTLEFESGNRWVKEVGNKRRFVCLTLKIGGNGGNGGKA